MKKWRLTRVQILGQFLVKHSPAETYNFATRVGDGKHQTRKELLVQLFGVPLSDEAETQRIFDRYLPLLDRLDQARSGWRRVAEHESSRHRLIHPSRLQII